MEIVLILGKAKAIPKASKSVSNKSKTLLNNSDNVIPEKKYSDYGAFVCVPMSSTKKRPIVKWKTLTKTPKSIFKPEHNIALITGAINQITVIDIDIPKPDKDEKDGMKKYEELLDKHNNGEDLICPTCISQSKGLHLYFKYDEDIKTSTGINGYSIDVRNDEALIIAPPSVGLKGPYVWKDDNFRLDNVELQQIPVWLKDWIMLSFIEKETKPKSCSKKKKKNDEYVMINDHIFIYEKADISDLLNALPNKYLNNYADWFIITSCLKSEDMKNEWSEWSMKSTKYDDVKNDEIWETLKPRVNIYYLIILAKKEGLDIDMNIIKKTKKIDFITKHIDTTIDEKYIDQKYLDNNIRNQIVKSACGTGKTTMTSSYIKALAHDSGYKILSLTVRVSLAYQQVKNFKDNKIIMPIYKDLDEDTLNNQNNLIIQIDSITKLDIDKWYNTIIYLDEVSSLFSYILTSATLKGKRVMVFNILYTILKQASYILCTDADVNDMVLCYFDRIGIKYHMIENTYKNIKETKAIEYDDKEIICRKMEQLLLDGEKIIVCFDSKKEMDLLVERLKKFCEDNELDKQLNNFVVYSSKEGDETDFCNINDKWKMKNVFYTPKITIGISFDNKLPRTVFLIAFGNSINSFGYVQQISRCRNISELHYFVDKKYQPLKYDKVDDVKNHYTDLLKNYESIYRDNKHIIDKDNLHSDIYDHIKLKDLVENNGASLDYQSGEWAMHDNVFNELFFMHEYYDHVLRSAPREQFRWMLEDKGFVVIYNEDRIEEEDLIEVGKNVKACKARVDENQDQMNKRALYNKESSLTDCEMKILNNAKRRANFLKIDFSKKVEKKKWESFLVDDKVFSQHYAFRLLSKTDDKLNVKIAEQIERDYNVLNAKSLLTKIKLIKQLEGILGMDTLDIDTKRDIDRFDENVDINENLRNMIKRVFRVTKKKTNNLEIYSYWHYQLIQMYKNVLGNNILKSKHTDIEGVQYMIYNKNISVINEHNLLLKS